MAEERVQRRLAAILAADVVGYSRLMETDEAGTLGRLKTLRREVFSPITIQFGGRIFKLTGDGAFAEFGSAANAVHSAVAIQRSLAERNSTLPENRHFELRIGISLGDVIVEGSDLYGNGVNVAARMEGLADPGGVCISGNVYEHVAHSRDLEFEDLGDQSVKNIDRLVRCYRVHLEGSGPSEGDTFLATPTTQLSDKPSIAVLPFDNLSNDLEQEYFVDGIVEDIITGLSRVKWLFVIARNSSFTYKGRAVDVKQVGHELGVRYVLEGSLRKAGNRVRITSQLIETTSGTHVWADRYDGPLDDIFDLQDEITLSVVGAIEPSLLQAEIERSKRKRPENLDAYDLYLRALPHARVAMPGDGEKALLLLHQSLDLQPDFAAAHAAAAWCYEQRYLRGGLHDDDKIAGLKHARAALEASADDATTIATAGFVIGLIEHDYETAMNAIDHALEVNSSSALALGLGSTILAHDGQIEKALDFGERALRLSPHDPTIYLPLTAIGIAHCAAGNFEEAVAVCNKAEQSNPRFSFPCVLRTAALTRLGRKNEAEVAARRVLELEPQFSIVVFTRSHTGRPEIWTPIGEALRQVGLPD